MSSEKPARRDPRTQRPQRDGNVPRTAAGGRRDVPGRAPRTADQRDGVIQRDKPTVVAPPIPDEIDIGQLDKAARARLRTLSKENAEDVGRHLVMAGLLLDDDPELAYRHALVAAARGGRVDVAREAVALTAYATGRYAEALREFRTVRRLNGSTEYVPLMADCERGMGRPERAIALAAEPEFATLAGSTRIELQIVVAGARMDMGSPEAALLTLERLEPASAEFAERIAEAKVDVLRALGRSDEATRIEAAIASNETPDDVHDDEIVVYDTREEES